MTHTSIYTRTPPINTISIYFSVISQGPFTNNVTNDVTQRCLKTHNSLQIYAYLAGASLEVLRMQHAVKRSVYVHVIYTGVLMVCLDTYKRTRNVQAVISHSPAFLTESLLECRNDVVNQIPRSQQFRTQFWIFKGSQETYCRLCFPTVFGRCICLISENNGFCIRIDIYRVFLNYRSIKNIFCRRNYDQIVPQVFAMCTHGSSNFHLICHTWYVSQTFFFRRKESMKTVKMNF